MPNAEFVRQRLRVWVEENLSPAAQSRKLAEVAKGRLGAEIAAGRASKSFRRFVDGKEGAPEDSVAPAPHGQIVYRFNHLGAVAVFALSFLKDRSPRASGHPARPANGKHGAYRDSFYVGVNGRAIPARNFNPNMVPPDAELIIYNINAYSRKVDVQIAGGVDLEFSIPPGIFSDAVKEIKRRYGTIVDVERRYTVKFSGQYILRREQYYESGRRKGRGRMRAGTPVESPALVITPRL